MVDFWRDFWIRETGTGQKVAQLHERYMMMMIYYDARPCERQISQVDVVSFTHFQNSKKEIRLTTTLRHDRTV